MSYVLNAVTAPDSYQPGSTIEDVPITGLFLDVANQSIYWQLKIAVGGGRGVWEASETYNMPGSRVIQSDRHDEIAGIRFRAATPAANLPAGAHQALVTIRTTP